MKNDLKMADDKEIRKFIKSGAPDVGDSGRFMKDLERQIDLLPVPASLAGRGKERCGDEAAAILAMAKSRKLQNGVMSAAIAVVAVAVFAVVFVILQTIPHFEEFIRTYSVYVMSGFSVVVACSVLLSLRHISI